MWHTASAAARRWVASAATFVALLGSLAAAWHAYERYLHHLHVYEQELRHARFVLRSSACAATGSQEGDAAHLSSRTKRYVDCDGALEALNGPTPPSRAIGSVLDEWTVCGEGRCAQAAQWGLEVLHAVRGAAPVVGALLVWMLAYRAWFGHQQRQARSSGLAPLDADASNYFGHRCLWAPGSEWELNAGGDHILAMAGPRVTESLRKRKVGTGAGIAPALKHDPRDADVPDYAL